MRIIEILSGGMDSATLLYHLIAEGHAVSCLAINYGQRHGRELEAAVHVAALAGVELQIVDLRALTPLLKGSSQTDAAVDVPIGRYDEPNMKLTVVPNRNMLMLAVAIAAAVGEKAEAVAYGAHAGDHTIYPDCRQEFVDAMRVASRLCDWHPVEILVPFQYWTKGDIAKRGLELGVPFILTWSCYRGEETPCGTCGACTERAEAFAFAQASDPLLVSP